MSAFTARDRDTRRHVACHMRRQRLRHYAILRRLFAAFRHKRYAAAITTLPCRYAADSAAPFADYALRRRLPLMRYALYGAALIC